MNAKTQSIMSFFFLFVILAGILTMVSVIYISLRSDSISDTIHDGKDINVLITIEKNVNELDYAVILFYNPVTRRGGLVHFPSNTGSIIESMEKVDSLAALYRDNQSSDFVNKIETLTSVNVDFTLRFSYEDIQKITDLTEGVELFLNNSIDLVDEEGHVKWLLPSGNLKLDGDKILTYLTYETEDDSEKIIRQQRFISSFIRAISNNHEYLEHEMVNDLFLDLVHSEMKPKALISYFRELDGMDYDSFIYQTVLGVMRDVDNQALLFPHYNEMLLKETVKQLQESLASQDLNHSLNRSITIEILNGTNKNNLALQTSQIFISYGYEVAYVKNYDARDSEKTVIYDRKGNITAGQKLADVIRCQSLKYESHPDFDENIDFSIILGKDFDGRYCR